MPTRSSSRRRHNCFVLGNVHAMQRYADRLKHYLGAVHAGAGKAELARLRGELRIDRLLEDLEPLVEGTIEGAERTRVIVDGLKRFSAVDREDHEVFNLVEIVERSTHWVTASASKSTCRPISGSPALPAKCSR